ncbi:MAG: hypothetical protein ACREN1_01340 [Candidatus Dormibacteria bacterium]
MASEAEFETAYRTLEERTNQFRDLSPARLREALAEAPPCLAPLRMILGLTHSELEVAIALTHPDAKVPRGVVKAFERTTPSERSRRRYAPLIDMIVGAALAAMERRILDVPPEVASVFHSKLDRRDTRHGWSDVAHDAAHGVPYAVLLYQRYIGGLWRQVQDAYSEAKGDNLLELPLEKLLRDRGIDYFRTPPGPKGARLASQTYGITPAPDFVLPAVSPTVVIEAKVGEDGGTVRDKASRIRNLAVATHAKGMIACALVDGKGWRERPSALLEVIVATEGRTYTLNTMALLLALPEIAGLARETPPSST